MQPSKRERQRCTPRGIEGGAIELWPVWNRRKIRDQEHALLGPATVDHIPHQIGSIAYQVIAMTKVPEVVIAAEPTDAYMAASRQKRGGATGECKNHIGVERCFHAPQHRPCRKIEKRVKRR